MNLSVLDAAGETPDRIALITEDAIYSYRDLASRVEAEISELRQHRAETNRPLPLIATRDLSTVVRLYTLLELGDPAALIHPRLTKRERENIPLDSPVDDSICWILFTSGSTGEPKGVMLQRAAILASAHASAENLGWNDADRWLIDLPLAHAGGLSILARCLAARRTVVLAPEGRFDAREARDRLARHRVTLASWVPTMLAQIFEEDPNARPPDHLRAILLGGAGASGDLLGQAADLGWPLLTTYGMTETCSQVTTQPFGTVNRGELGAGETLANVQLRIVDNMIEVRTETLFAGYYPKGSFDSHIDTDGWFRTGDFGRLLENGCLQLLGRSEDRIVTGGENVAPAEVEKAIEGLSDVKAVCVFGVPDATWGEIVVAAVVLRKPVDETTLRAQLEPQLAPHKRPRVIHFLTELPLTATGKIDRATLRREATELSAV